jgi:hypothetical protein
MVPFGIAISIMGTRELWLNVVKPWQERRKLGDNRVDDNRARDSNNPAAIVTPLPQPVRRFKKQA